MNFGKGFSVDNLQNIRQLFLTYSIYETTSRISSSDSDKISSTGLKKSPVYTIESISQNSSAKLKNSDISAASISDTIPRKFVLSCPKRRKHAEYLLYSIEGNSQSPVRNLQKSQSPTSISEKEYGALSCIVCKHDAGKNDE
jgi:hypothetical protein